MITFIHILIALTSVAYLSALIIRPLRLSFGFAHLSIGGTLGTGILLMIVQPSTIPHVCMSGTVYLATAIAAVVFARYRRRILANSL